jgi:hypothetical protein
MRGGKAQDFVKNVIPANQLGNRFRQVRWRQPPQGIAPSGRASRGPGCAAAIAVPASASGLPYTLLISAVNW